MAIAPLGIATQFIFVHCCEIVAIYENEKYSIATCFKLKNKDLNQHKKYGVNKTTGLH